MTKVSYLLLLSVILFTACSDEGGGVFKKAKTDGTEYKIIRNKGGKLVTKGNVLRMDIVVRYKDSLLYSTHETGMPRYAPYDTSNFPPLYKEVFKTIHVGDSIVFKVATDSIMKRGQGAAFMNKGQFIYETYKISDAYLSQKEADVEIAKSREKAAAVEKVKAAEQLKKDDKTLQDYFAKNNIKPVKGKEGTYVEMITPGIGNNVDTNVVVLVNYTGRTLNGTMFDSNTDSSKGKVGTPLNANMTSDPAIGRYTIAGWKDGLMLLNKGAKAKFYIPSPLAYGPQAVSEDIPANSILIFDIEVVDILNREQAKSNADKDMAKLKARQSAMRDSAMKARMAMKSKMDTTDAKKK